MPPPPYTTLQLEIMNLPISGRYFLEGYAGSGKTTSVVGRLEKLLSNIPGHQILILVPQRSLGKPYFDYFSNQDNFSGSMPGIMTIGGFARRMVDLFWPIIAQDTELSDPQSPPYFLSMETAQYCLDKVLEPYFQKGFFQSVVIEKSRLYGQILDNMNKSAIVPFPILEISERLKAVHQIDASLKIAFDQVQICAEAFRAYSLRNNLIDYSLLIEIFKNHIFNKDFFNSYLDSSYHAIIADNIEEDVPVLHNFIKAWMPGMESVMLVYDKNGGYRSFLGADSESAFELSKVCDQQFEFPLDFSQSLKFKSLNIYLSACIQKKKIEFQKENDLDSVLTIQDFHFYPQMIRSVCEEIQNLINVEGIPPHEIVVLSPYLSDALYFSLNAILGQSGISSKSSRPSRKYADDPVIRSMLTIAKLAHPKWELTVSKFEFRNSLLICLQDIDLSRADLITQTLHNKDHQSGYLGSFDSLTNTDTQNKITFHLGEKIESLRDWLQIYQSGDPQPLDIFISTIFGELLSQLGFGLFNDYDAADRIAKLILSIKHFRLFASAFLGLDEISSGIEYIRTIQDGLLPSTIFQQEEEPINSVLVAPAHSYLMQNHATSYQFWLDIGNLGWWERLNQPLTNPYLLNRYWKKDQVWTIANENSANQDAMLKVVQGLLNRCKDHVYAYSVHTNEHGTEQRGPLLKAFQSLQKQKYSYSGGRDV